MVLVQGLIIDVYALKALCAIDLKGVRGLLIDTVLKQDQVER